MIELRLKFPGFALNDLFQDGAGKVFWAAVTDWGVPYRRDWGQNNVDCWDQLCMHLAFYLNITSRQDPQDELEGFLGSLIQRACCVFPQRQILLNNDKFTRYSHLNNIHLPDNLSFIGNLAKANEDLY